MLGAQAVLAGCLFHTLIDEVVIIAVAHGIDVVDDGDERRSRGHIVGVGLEDRVAVLGAGREQNHWQDGEQGGAADAVLHRPLDDVLTAVYLTDDGLVLLF